LNVPTNFIFGLSSFESGWFDNHNVALNNLLGLTQGGGNNIQFSSIQAGNSYFVSRVGPFIQGALTQAAFFKWLQAEGYNCGIDWRHLWQHGCWYDGLLFTSLNRSVTK